MSQLYGSGPITSIFCRLTLFRHLHLRNANVLTAVGTGYNYVIVIAKNKETKSFHQRCHETVS